MVRRVLVPHAVVPGSSAGVGRRARRRAQVRARPDDPEEQQEARDGADNDAGDGAAREGACLVEVVARCGAVIVGIPSDYGHGCARGGLALDEGGREQRFCGGEGAVQEGVKGREDIP